MGRRNRERTQKGREINGGRRQFLCAVRDSIPDGVLSTELKQAGRNGHDLACAVPITDGAWHQVGLTWDGSSRSLYVDGVEVVTDTQVSLSGSATSLYLGTGSRLAPGTYWSGLIDDVRVYKRAVRP